MSLDELFQKRSQDRINWTAAMDRKFLSALVAYLRNKNVTTIVGNEQHFKLLFEKYLAGASLFDAPSTLDYDMPEYQLLYLYYLQQQLAGGHLLSEANDSLDDDHLFLQSDLTVHSRDLDCVLQRCAMSLHKKNRNFTLATIVLDYVVRAAHDILIAKTNNAEELQNNFQQFEQSFDWAYFGIYSFASLPAERCPAKYSALAEKCRLDLAKLQGTFDMSAYHEIWTFIRQERVEDSPPDWLEEKVLNLLLYIYNIHGSFVFFHNRFKSPQTTDGAGVEGLVSTALRIDRHSCFTIDLKSALQSMLQSAFVRMHKQEEKQILLRMKQIFASVCSVANWVECIDIVSGRGGEGASRLVQAVSTRQLPLPNCQPSFFYTLDNLPSVKFDWSFLPDGDAPKLGYSTFGHTTCRLQSRMQFATLLSPLPQKRLSLSTINLVFGKFGVPFGIVLQCLYFSACNKPQQQFLHVQLDSILAHCQNNPLKIGSLAVELAEKSSNQFETFRLDRLTGRSSIDVFVEENLSLLQEAELVQQTAQLEGQVFDRLDSERQTRAGQRLDRVRIDMLKVNGDAANANKIYGQGQVSTLTLAGLEDQPKVVQKVQEVPKPVQKVQEVPKRVQKVQEVPKRVEKVQEVPERVQVDSQATTQQDPDDDVDDKPKTAQQEDGDDDVDDKPNTAQQDDDNNDDDEKPAKIARKETPKKVDAPKKVKEPPKKRGRKRKSDSESSIAVNLDENKEEEEEEPFVSYALTTENAKKQPEQILVWTYWPLLHDCTICCGNKNQQVVGEDLEWMNIKNGGIWQYLLPFKNARELELCKEHHPHGTFYLDLWTMEFDRAFPFPFSNERETLARKYSFEADRAKFLKHWAKTLWLSKNDTFLVHIGSEHLENIVDGTTDEFDRLIFGSGFLEFPGHLIRKHLGPKIGDLTSQQRHIAYPWREDADGALNFFKAAVRNSEPCMIRRDDEFKIRTNTYQTLVWPKSSVAELPQPQTGVSLQQRRTLPAKQTARTASSTTRGKLTSLFTDVNEQSDDDGEDDEENLDDEQEKQGRDRDVKGRYFKEKPAEQKQKKSKTAEKQGAAFGIYEVENHSRTQKLRGKEQQFRIVRSNQIAPTKDTGDFACIDESYFLQLSSKQPNLYASLIKDDFPEKIRNTLCTEFPEITKEQLKL